MEAGLSRDKVSIAHCENEAAAVKLREMIARELPQVSVRIGINRGLCSYCAEKGGLQVGFVKF